ncbi:DUF58 domain-containing protein [Haloferax sp. YSMS24]|uniref:DUF58 domain-containing protein n=1 Tax=Haloferax sp. YSMS24 TaxID=3388425 RepID=UPI00398C9D4F
MVPSRRWAVLAGTACFFAVYAVVLNQPAPLLAAGGLTAWLLVTQLNAVQTMSAADEALSTAVSVEQTTVFVDGRAAVTLTASLSSPVDAPLDVELVMPPSVEGPPTQQRSLRIEPGETTASTTCSVTFPIAGRISFETVNVELADRAGYFTETVTNSVDAQCLVEPPSPDGIHVGRGGEIAGGIFGEHSSEQTGPGLVPHETRQYLPGDTLSQVDWKTTARMNHPHIREFESESDYLLTMVVDARSQMNRGPPGRTMFDFGREVALGLVGAAESHSDPISARLVSDDTTAWEFGPSSSLNAYQMIRRHLLTADPADGYLRRDGQSRPLAPTEALARGHLLEGDESRFATTLRPFLATSSSYVSRVNDDPLFTAVKASCGRGGRDDHLVLITDDSSKVETYEAVVVASKRSSQTSVFLTPNVLFDGPPIDRERYVAFEEFRRRLDRLPNVTAYEVSPTAAIELARTETAAAPE